MKKLILSLTFLIFLAPFFAAAQQVAGLKPSHTVLLYADSFEGNIDPVFGKEIVYGGFKTQESNGLTGPETITERGMLKNVSDLARVDLYFPKKPNGQMVVVCPGGGYLYLSIYGEGQYVADWMLSKGITVAVVKHRIPNGHWNIPLEDVQNVFRYCRAHADEWKIKQIGVIGFSAGGHLAATASTLWTDTVTRPDFSILIYPVITLTPGTTHHGTHKNLLGEKNMMKEKYLDRYSLEKQVCRYTPPTFIALCSDDATVPAENSLRYYNELINHDVPAEMHIWPTGGHGWGFNEDKYIGEGKDRFAYAREEYYIVLERWLQRIR